MNEEVQAIIASLTTEDNTLIIESLINAITVNSTIANEPCQECIIKDSKYGALQAKYVERFMSGVETEPATETETETETENTNESEDSTIDNIFEEE